MGGPVLTKLRLWARQLRWIAFGSLARVFLCPLQIYACDGESTVSVQARPVELGITTLDGFVPEHSVDAPEREHRGG